MAYNKPPKITGFMPEKMHKDDEQWIFAKLSVLSKKSPWKSGSNEGEESERFKVCVAYTNVFNSAFNEEPLPHRKTGRARYAANNRLRIYIDKKFAVFNK